MGERRMGRQKLPERWKKRRRFFRLSHPVVAAPEAEEGSVLEDPPCPPSIPSHPPPLVQMQSIYCSADGGEAEL